MAKSSEQPASNQTKQGLLLRLKGLQEHAQVHKGTFLLFTHSQCEPGTAGSTGELQGHLSLHLGVHILTQADWYLINHKWEEG